MADLLELVIEPPILSPYLFWSLPSNVFEGLVDKTVGNTNLIASYHLIPSRQNQLTSHYLLLSSKEQQVLHSIVADSSTLEKPLFVNLSQLEKVRIVETLMDYYQFLLVEAPQNSTYQSMKNRLLMARLSLPPNQFSWPKIQGNPPHFSQKPTKIQFGYVHLDSQGTGIELGFRAAYFDFLALDAARVPNAQLKKADLRLILLNNKLQVMYS